MTQREECGGTYIGVSECTRREEYDGIGGGSKWGVSINDGTGSPEKLRELRIGSQSFMDYSVCEIEGVDSLEVIEMGRLNDRSSFFHYASLELKSCSNETK